MKDVRGFFAAIGVELPDPAGDVAIRCFLEGHEHGGRVCLERKEVEVAERVTGENDAGKLDGAGVEFPDDRVECYAGCKRLIEDEDRRASRKRRSRSRPRDPRDALPPRPARAAAPTNA
jgi:hypothetical protein